MPPLPSRVYLTIAALLLWPGASLAQERPRLPSGAQLLAIVEELRRHAAPATLTAHATIERCTLAADALRCTCVVDDSGWTIASLVIRGDTLHIKDASGPGESGERWAIHELVVRPAGWEMKRLIWSPSPAQPTLHIARLAGAQDGAQLDAAQLSWHIEPQRPATTRCGERLDSKPDAAPLLTAALATWREGWTLREASASWLEFKGESKADRRRDGLLPPILRADAAGFEYGHALGIDALPFLPGVLLSPRRWYGVEAIWLPTSATQRPLAASIIWAHDGGLSASLFGQAVLGDVQGLHLSVDAERTTGPDAIRQLRRIEQDTWLRSWRSSRVGLGLSSGSLMLQSALSADVAPWAMGSKAFGASLGDSIQTGAQSSVETRVEHWTALGTAQAAQHHSAMMMGWSQRWGSPGKIEGSAGVLGAMGLDTTDGAEQWRAATNAALAAHARVQLHLVGRFERWSHHLLPHASLLLAPPGISTPQQASARLGLDQSARSRDGRWSVEAPIGLWLDWRADRASGERRLPYAALNVRARSAWLDARLSGSLLCVELCDARYGMGQLTLSEAHSGLSLIARTGYADTTSSLLLGQSSGAQSAMFSAEVQRQLLGDTLTRPARLDGSGLSWRGGHHEVSATLWRSDALSGASGGYGFALPGVGWGLSVMGAWADDGRWSTWLGLSI